MGYARPDAQFVASLGVPYHYVPFGYAPYYESIFQQNTNHEAVVEDIDVLFVGFVSERRRVVLERIRAAGLKLEVATYDNPLRGAALDRAIARSRIVLSIFAAEDPAAQVPDFARLDHLLSNKRFVLHEQLPVGARHAEFEQHVPSCAYDDFPQQCIHFLQHPAERARVAAAAHDWFKTQCRMSDSVPFSEIRALLR
ncbi:MAG: hypothetical protein H7Z40_12780 [Phycisphaerae bacterium]|nr:hypothetical protein [Gemmatimonadaceae bacterium]